MGADRLMEERQDAGAVSETLLACIGPSPTSARVILSSQRMALSLNARWIAVNVESRQIHELDPVERHQLAENIHLARRLGAEVVSLSSQDVAEGIIGYARSRGATRIVIGKSEDPPWRRLFRQSIAERLLRLSGDIDIFVVQSSGPRDRRAGPSRPWRATRWGYVGAMGAVVVACLIALLLQEAGLSEANKAVVFIPAVVMVAISWGLGPGVLAAVASVLAFDFFFVPPYLTLAVRDIQYLVTLVVMAAVALLVGTLAARLRRQVETTRARERRLEALYRLTRGLSGVSGVDEIVRVAEAEVGGVFGSPVTIYLPREDGSLARKEDHEIAVAIDSERQAATWAFEHGELAGRGTDTLSQAKALHAPMITAHGTVGVLTVEASEEAIFSPDNQQLLEAAATQIGIAIERDMLAEISRKAVLEAETERMRSSLLSSVSHDLRTPLAVISGSASTLLQLGESGTSETRTALLTEVWEESNRLTRLVENLLAMTRLDSGVIKVDKQWFPLEDVVGSALGRLRKENQNRVVSKHWPADLPLVPLDGVMIEQVLFNLLDNAIRYSEPGTPVDLFISSTPPKVLNVDVADRGPGLAEEELNLVFDKLYRGSAASDSARGAGLGLAIARAIVHAHGGEIWAANRPGGGAVFSFSLPLEPPPEPPPGEVETDVEACASETEWGGGEWLKNRP